MRGKSCRPSGDCAIARLDDLVRRHACVMSSPCEADRAVARVDQAVDRAQRRRLAGAVRADQRDDLALADLERDALAAPGSCRRTSSTSSTSSSGCAVDGASCSRGRRRCRGRPRSPAGRCCTPSACPRRSSRRSRARSRGRRRPSRRFMSCSISRTRQVALRRAGCCDERRELGGLLRVHARGRLVEQQQLRLRSRARARPRAGAGRRRAGSSRARCPRAAQAGEREQLVRALARLRFLAAHARRAEDRSERFRLAAGRACRRARSRARSSPGRGGCSGTCGRSRAA